MKKHLLTLSAALTILSGSVNSQSDTLLWADFETDPSAWIQWQSFPSGGIGDTLWYNYDGDGIADGSGGSRPLEWFWSTGFAPVDSTNGVLASSSWTNGSSPTDNWLITGSIDITDTNATLYWKAAPRQTPRYIDGYYVFVSTNTNDFADFTDTLFMAGEYLSLDNTAFPNSYSSYSFSSGFVHGADNTYTWFDPASDSSRLVGVLRPFQKSLKSYVGKSIYLAFVHHSVDDNLLSIDDILVRNTSISLAVKKQMNDIKFKAYPNPASEKMYLNMMLQTSSEVSIHLFDITGRKVYDENLGKLSSGQHYHTIDVANLAPGMYQVQMTTEKGASNFKLQVK